MNMNEEYKMCFSTKKQSKKNLSLKKVWALLTCQPPHHPAFWVVVSIATGFSGAWTPRPPTQRGSNRLKASPSPLIRCQGLGGWGTFRQAWGTETSWG